MNELTSTSVKDRRAFVILGPNDGLGRYPSPRVGRVETYSRPGYFEPLEVLLPLNIDSRRLRRTPLVQCHNQGQDYKF